jgi:hypothetical protein
MNWTKIPTNLLISRTPDNELVAIVKYQLLWADLEYQPTDEIALRYMTNKQLASVKQYLNDIEAQVVSDIKSTVSHRGGQKTYYKKKQRLTQNTDGHTDNHTDGHTDTQTDGADKIRLDKIRLDKEINKEIDDNFEKFWANYLPITTTSGCVQKGSKKDAKIKYIKAVKLGANPDDIFNGMIAYLKDCQQNNRFSCAVVKFLGHEYWKNEYNTPTIIAQPHRQPTQKELKDFEYEQKKAALLAEIEKRTTK